MDKKRIKFNCTLLIFVLNFNMLYSQTNRFSNGYFNSNIFTNPSLPGLLDDVEARFFFKTPMNNSIPGLQKNSGFQLTKPFADGSAVGINILKESEGLLINQYLLLNYAVDIKISEKSHIRSGLSFGFRDLKLDQSVISQSYSNYFGNSNDPVLLSYANKAPSFYSGLGLTFYNKNLDIQFILPNISYYFKKSDSSIENKPMIFGAGYLIPINSNSVLGNNSNLKFQIGYYNNLVNYQKQSIITAGAILNTSHGISFEMFYNNSGNLNTGIGIDILNKYGITINYIIGGVNSTEIYGGSGVALLGFKLKMPKIYSNKLKN